MSSIWRRPTKSPIVCNPSMKNIRTYCILPLWRIILWYITKTRSNLLFKKPVRLRHRQKSHDCKPCSRSQGETLFLHHALNPSSSDLVPNSGISQVSGEVGSGSIANAILVVAVVVESIGILRQGNKLLGSAWVFLFKNSISAN